MRLDELLPGSRATVLSVGGTGAFRRHLLELGLVPGTSVARAGQSPVADPLVLQVRGASIGVRRCDAHHVEVEPA